MENPFEKIPGQIPPDLQRMLQNGAQIVQQAPPLIDERILYMKGYGFTPIYTAGDPQLAIVFDVPSGPGMSRISIPFENAEVVDRFIAQLTQAREAFYAEP